MSKEQSQTELGLDLLERGLLGIYMHRLAEALGQPIVMHPNTVSDLRKHMDEPALEVFNRLEGKLWVESVYLPTKGT